MASRIKLNAFEPVNGFIENDKAAQCRTNQKQKRTHSFGVVFL